ncbi:type I restriction endonuclease subunit R, partial [Lactococcus lactis subsp. lactis]|nr:type I restriction endonuclease subunit R [Lactococcus lactis subsp. lactis]
MSHSEQMIENQFIQILSEKENQWTYRPDLKSEEALWQNFRGHLNRINLAVLEEQLLTDKEFKQVKVEFSRLTGTPFLASQWLRGENGVAQVLLEREDGKKVTLEAFRNKDISGGTSSYEVV